MLVKSSQIDIIALIFREEEWSAGFFPLGRRDSEYEEIAKLLLPRLPKLVGIVSGGRVLTSFVADAIWSIFRVKCEDDYEKYSPSTYDKVAKRIVNEVIEPAERMSELCLI